LFARILLFEASFISFDFSFSFFSAAKAAAAAAWTASASEAGFSFEVTIVAGAEITTFLVLKPSDDLEGSDSLLDDLF
jgi:hypothetical protein